ncbi:hypothetical protein [Streptomyces inhibens]|nr:hypothetical protein [Streptomyces inhibens]UKY53887.1 hypothetical protein KI385_37190 [Streptomyces inhibens]
MLNQAGPLASLLAALAVTAMLLSAAPAHAHTAQSERTVEASALDSCLPY